MEGPLAGTIMLVTGATSGMGSVTALRLAQQGASVVPATMRLLGRWNWWAPAPLRFIWRRIGLSEAESA
jgi:trehalose monomycolate/heme transporter